MRLLIVRLKHIKKEEINKITAECQIREQAFFTIMRQSGLAPHVIQQLRVQDVQRILEPEPPIPCKITTQLQKQPTFIGHEAVKHLKLYLATRENLMPQSLLFTSHDNPNKQINTKDVSRAFQRAAQQLNRRGEITYKVKSEEPSELRLYSLVDFYRTIAKDYVKELDSVSAPKDDEFYRRLYEQKAMPFLEIELPTPMEMHQLTDSINKILKKTEGPQYEEPPPELMEKWKKEHEKSERARAIYLEKHPEEKKKQELEWEEAYRDFEREEQYRKEHPEIIEQEKKEYVQGLEKRIDELEEAFEHIKKTVQKLKT